MKYKVLSDFVLNGILQKAESVIELDHKMSSLKSIQANIEKMPIEAATPASTIPGVVPGQLLTEEQKAKLAKDNQVETAEAHRLAADQRARDIAEGKGEPVVKTVADSLKEKLVNEDFNKGIPTEEILGAPEIPS
jgi:hypothetical protein